MTKNIEGTNQSDPIIDEVAPSSDLTQFMLLGVFLFLGVAGLWLFGREKLGEPIFLVILGVFASVGIFFLFSLVLGMVQLSSRKNTGNFHKNLVGEMDAGVAVTDHNGRLVYANRAYANLLGANEAAEIVSVETLFSRRPEANDIIYKMANAVKTGEVSVEEFRLGSGLRNGEEGARWFRVRARSLNSEGYSKPLLVWQVSDVTEDRGRQETAFQELQDAIHYLDHAPAGFLSSEANGALVYMNATLADWLGMDLTRFMQGALNLRDIIVGDNVALLEAIKPDENKATTNVVDLDMIKSDGTLLPVRLYHKIPQSSDGAPGATRTLVLNRASEASEEDALRDAEIRFARFFNSTPVAIAGVDKDGQVVRTNAPFQRMFSSVVDKHGSSTGMKYTKVVAKEDRQQFKEVFRNALSGKGKIDPVDLAIYGEDGRYVRFFVNQVADDASATGREKENSGEEHIIIFAMETTEQRALEDQFAKGQKMQAVGQLAGGVAHDFNNVLTAIIGFSDLLLANHKPSDPSFQDIMNIKQNANRAASLVRQLLAFSRRQTLRPQVMQISDALSDLRMLLDRLLGENVELKVRHGRDLWPIKADISQLEQVVVNLVVNARDAMDSKGKLEIRTSNVTEAECRERFSYNELVAADYVLVEVEDEGSGMRQEVLEKIFEPFFSTKEVGKGTGLGLSTVYGIVKQTGGFIYPESIMGQGTTFLVFLPRHVVTEDEIAEAAREASVSKKEEPAKDLTGSSTILLVEDEDAVRAFGSRALTSRGYEVHEAASGVEALEVMEEVGDSIDLVVSDVVMPEMDGPTLLGELRKNYPDLKFIFVSGYAEEAFAKNLPEEEREKFGFLAKPFSLKQLATTVKERLEEK